MSTARPRLVALRVLQDVLQRQLTLDESLQQRLPRLTDSRDRGLAQRLAYSVIRWRLPLQQLTAGLLRKPLKSKDGDIQLLIQLGLAQLWLEQMPAHAAINETAGTARNIGKPWAVGLVNASLRNFTRSQEDLLKPLQQRDEWLLSHPSWLLRRLQQDWPQDWRELAVANNEEPPLWLRINLGQTSLADYQRLLDEQSVPWQPHPTLPAALQCTQPMPVIQLPGFQQGLFSVQDPAAQAAATLLDLRPGLRVLDACAAPGGKTTHILELEPAVAELTALDVNPQRLARVRQNLQRLGLDCQVVAGDGLQPQGWWDGKLYDRILLDAPCSATGVIRRHPDIKWLRSEAQLEALCATQQQLLNSLWPLLHPGGRLVYATCSVLSCENQRQIEAFIQGRKDAEIAAIQPAWGTVLNSGWQLLPQRDGSDGFYYAVLHKQQ